MPARVLPPDDELLPLLRERPAHVVADELGLSRASVRSRARRLRAAGHDLPTLLRGRPAKEERCEG